MRKDVTYIKHLLSVAKTLLSQIEKTGMDSPNFTQLFQVHFIQSLMSPGQHFTMSQNIVGIDSFHKNTSCYLRFSENGHHELCTYHNGIVEACTKFHSDPIKSLP